MSSTEDRSPRGLRRRVLAGAGAAAVVAGLLVALAPSAGAASAPIADGQLNWGFKSSFRTYIVTIAGGSITPSDGASFDGTGQTKPYIWDGSGGAYDPATNSGIVDFAGKVVFSAPNHTIWHITLANPTVVLDGDSSAKLLADVSYSTGGAQAAPENQASGTDIHIADLTVGTPTGTGPTFTFGNVPATLTAAGAAAFDDFYAAGTALDALTFTVGLADVTPPAKPTVTLPKVNATNQAAVPVSGSGEAGTTAAISVDDAGNAATPPVTATVPVAANGTYGASLDLSSLSDSTLTATVTLTDGAGNVSQPATATAKKSTAPAQDPLAGLNAAIAQLLASIQALLAGLGG